MNHFYRISPRPISTTQLHVLPHFYLLPINLVIFQGTYRVNPVRDLILWWTSYLDAFSTYSLRTQLPGVYHWRDNRYTGGSSVPVLSY
jgi:hypothetical protein